MREKARYECQEINPFCIRVSLHFINWSSPIPKRSFDLLVLVLLRFAKSKLESGMETRNTQNQK